MKVHNFGMQLCLQDGYVVHMAQQPQPSYIIIISVSPQTQQPQHLEFVDTWTSSPGIASFILKLSDATIVQVPFIAVGEFWKMLIGLCNIHFLL